MNQCPHTILLVFPDDHGTPTLRCELDAGHDGSHAVTYRQGFHVCAGGRTEFQPTVVRIEWTQAQEPQ